MLERDELLPEEQAHPAFIQELQTIYQLEAPEKQVLAHVHERLARQVATSVRPIKTSEPARALRLVPPVSSTSRAVKAPRRWRRISEVAVILCVALLIGALSLTFMNMHHLTSVATGGNTIQLVLVPTEKGVVLSQTELDMTRTRLAQRFNSFGLSDVSVQATTSNRHPAIQVKMSRSDSNEQTALSMLLASDVLEFWNTGPMEMVSPGRTFDPGQYTQYNPGNKAAFTGNDLASGSPKVTKDPATGRFSIQFSMRGDAIQRFQSYTAGNLGNFLTITLDRKVLESASINGAISGVGEITGNFTLQQANAIAAALKSGALPVALTTQS